VLVQGGLDPRHFALETIGSACEPIENGTAAGKSLSMSAHGIRPPADVSGARRIAKDKKALLLVRPQ
jgi:hypothetical protein